MASSTSERMLQQAYQQSSGEATVTFRDKHCEPLRLPPELVRQVFQCLIPPKYPSSELPLDLLASSLVCRLWCYEARPLLDNEKFQPRFLPGATMKRFANLLVESKSIGLDYCDFIREITITGYWFDEDERPNEDESPEEAANVDDVEEAFETILALRPPNLVKACIDFESICSDDPVPMSPASIQKMNRFLDRIQPFCKNISFLSLYGFDIWTDPPPIPNFISALSTNLQSLELDNIRLDPVMLLALYQCAALEIVEVVGISAEQLIPVLPYWPRLRRFRAFEGFADATIDQAVMALVTSCPLLVEFKVEFDDPDEGGVINAGTLCYLLARCRDLRCLFIVNNLGPDDLMLAAMLTHGKALEHVNLAGCERITGMNLLAYPSDVGGWWPKLRTLDLVGCDRLLPTFVEKVLRECLGLREIRVPEHLNTDARFLVLMERHEFRPGLGWWSLQ